MSSEATKNLLDAASVGTLVGYFISALPLLAVIFTVIWAIFRVVEMRTTHVLLFKWFGWRLDEWMHLPGSKFKYNKDD